MKKKKNSNSNNRRSKEEELDTNEREWDFKTILKDVQSFSASHMTWKERKDFENRKVVSLGGKAVKKQRLPLSVARVQMKKQKEREQKIQEQNALLGYFRGRLGGDNGAKRTTGKRRPEDRVLKSTEGHFKNGVLDVKHLLRSAPSRDNGSSAHAVNDRKKKNDKGSGKKNKGKKKGGRRKRH